MHRLLAVLILGVASAGLHSIRVQPHALKDVRLSGQPIAHFAVARPLAGRDIPGAAGANEGNRTDILQLYGGYPPEPVVFTIERRPVSVPEEEPFSVNPTGHADRWKLVREIQRELTRAGCYRGQPDGRWNGSTKQAMGAFLSSANARLPFDEPDYILLSLAQGHAQIACGNDPSLYTRPESNSKTASRKSDLPGRMGIGGPKPDADDANQESAASTGSKVQIPRSHPRGESRNAATRVTSEGQLVRNRYGASAVRERLTHPLGNP